MASGRAAARPWGFDGKLLQGGREGSRYMIFQEACLQREGESQGGRQGAQSREQLGHVRMLMGRRMSCHLARDEQSEGWREAWSRAVGGWGRDRMEGVKAAGGLTWGKAEGVEGRAGFRSCQPALTGLEKPLGMDGKGAVRGNQGL